MVNMEKSKYCKLRRVKGSSKRKKNISVNECPEPRIEKQETGERSAITTPPRHSTIIERKPDEVRGVEWQYHGKFVETDIPVVWGSPHGSPVINTGLICESPINRGRRRTLSSAPRKLNTEECEPPQFLNEILALSEKIKAKEKVNEKTSSSPLNEQNELKISKNVLEESFSNFFDEDMNECMLQCSQELEETSMPNVHLPAERKGKETCGNDSEKKKSVESETPCISSRGNISVSSSSKSTINTTSGVFYLGENGTESQKNSPRVGNKNYVLCNRKSNTYVFQGRVLGSEQRSDRAFVGASSSETLKSNSSHLYKNSDSKSLIKSLKSPKSNRSRLSLDNSFETVKESFLDDDLDLLSAIPDDLEMVVSEKTGPPVRKSVVSSEPEQQDLNQLPSASVLDDSTYFEDGVLQYLDSIESNVTSTQPLRCTPEEIEKKRQEAKLKLKKKQMIAKK